MDEPVESPDFFDTFGLPEITGKEDVEMVEFFTKAAPTAMVPSEENKMAYVEEAPSTEHNKTNEERILDFFAGMDDHQAAVHPHDGDAVDVYDKDGLYRIFWL